MVALKYNCFDNVQLLFYQEENVPGALYLKSKHGQQYQCSYLDKSSEERREKEDERAALETGIPELLKPMEEGPCLVHVSNIYTIICALDEGFV